MDEYISKKEAILAVTRDGCTENVVGVLYYLPTADVAPKSEIAFWMDAAANAKKEVVKEFAEKLKKECLFDRGYEILQDGTIDHLVKEFTEE